MIYALRIGWCALESVDTEIKHLDNWLIDWFFAHIVYISSQNIKWILNLLASWKENTGNK